MGISEARRLFQEGILGIRLVGKLSSFLKQTIRPERATALLRQRLERREKDFLDLAKKIIFGHPRSPYTALLKHAGIEYGDLHDMVMKQGLEDSLLSLYRSGVYLTAREFRGQREAIRGSTRFTVNPPDLINPHARRHIPIRSSGSRSHGTQVVRDLAFVYDNTVALVGYLEARKRPSPELATWSVPGGVILSSLIKFNLAGFPPSRWFSQLDPHGRELNLRYRLSARVMDLSGKLAGISVPRPEYVSLEEPLPIIHWIKESLKIGRTPHLFTFSSSAVRLAQHAVAAGVDLQGAQITLSGEPITPARLASVNGSGAEALPAMGCVEAGHIGYGCLRPEAADDMHLLTDLHAVIQPGQPTGDFDLRPGALLFTSLRFAAPLILLNVSMGDQAVLRQRSCGCRMGDLGLVTHLHDVRSFEKLTSGGMALLDTELIRILDEGLPELFGGGPTDYQLWEDEREGGRPHLRLMIHPRVGWLDSESVKKTFLNLIASNSGADRLTSLLWRDADVVTIERSPPLTTSTGKIHHMHIKNGSGPDT
jgi:hypothetical protein